MVKKFQTTWGDVHILGVLRSAPQSSVEEEECRRAAQDDRTTEYRHSDGLLAAKLRSAKPGNPEDACPNHAAWSFSTRVHGENYLKQHRGTNILGVLHFALRVE